MSQQQLHDYRVYFAAERTQLAWVRSGLSVIALGFVVSRFGMFLQSTHGANDHAGFGLSGMLGIGFVLLGATGVALATSQHRRFVASLPPAFVPDSHQRGLLVPFSMIIAVLGLLLAAYLGWSHLQHM